MRNVIISSKRDLEKWNKLTEAEQKEILTQNTQNYPKLQFCTTTNKWQFYKPL